MPNFKHPRNGSIFEVSEEHAATVLRPQGSYVEVFPEPEPEIKEKVIKVAKKKSKKKSKKIQD